VLANRFICLSTQEASTVAEPSIPAEARDHEIDQLPVAEALSDVSAALSSTLELEDVLDLILDRAARVVPCIFGTVLLIEGDHAEVMRARDTPIRCSACGSPSPISGVV
jgi:hypothetical protein